MKQVTLKIPKTELGAIDANFWAFVDMHELDHEQISEELFEDPRDCYKIFDFNDWEEIGSLLDPIPDEPIFRLKYASKSIRRVFENLCLDWEKQYLWDNPQALAEHRIAAKEFFY